MRIARPCRTCKRATRNANGYCDKHKPTWDHAKTTTERGYGWGWQKLRERILERDGGLCQPCERAGRHTLAREVDHIINKASGGDDAPENLEAICTHCHRAKSQREASGGARGGSKLHDVASS